MTTCQSCHDLTATRQLIVRHVQRNGLPPIVQQADLCEACFAPQLAIVRKGASMNATAHYVICEFVKDPPRIKLLPPRQEPA